MVKVLVVNSYGRADKGDAALLDCAIKDIRNFLPDAEFSIGGTEDPDELPSFQGHKNVFSMRQYAALAENSGALAKIGNVLLKIYTLLSVRWAILYPWLSSLAPKKMSAYIRAFREADIVMAVGGGYFNAKDALATTSHLFFVTQPLATAQKMGKFTVVSPVSVGPFVMSYQARIVARCFDKLDVVCVREDISYQLAKKLMTKPPIKAVDSAFAFDPKGTYDLRKRLGTKPAERLIGMTVRKNFDKARQDVYEQNIADFLVLLNKSHPEYTVVFMPQCTAALHGDDDRKVAGRICDKLPKGQTNAVVLQDDLDYVALKLAYRDVDYVIGTRFHSVIFALPYDVPAIGLEYEYKTRGIMRDLGLEEWIIKVNELTGAKLDTMFSNLLKNKKPYLAQLHKTLPAYIAKAEEASKIMEQSYAQHVAEHDAATQQ